MSCPDEIELSMYADRALTGGAADRVRRHSEGCSACAALLESLETERFVLREALRAIDETADVPAFRFPASRGIVPAAALLIGLAASSLVAVELLSSMRLPQPFAWLNPFTPAGLLDLLLAMLVTTVTEGRTMLASTIGIAAAAGCAVLLAAAAVALRGRAKRSAALLTIAVMAISVSPRSDALEIRRSEGILSVPSGETIDDTLIAMAETVEIDGIVTGDLIAMGGRVIVRGEVRGQVVSGARYIEIEGTVGGSVLAFAESVWLGRAVIENNLFSFARQLSTGENASIAGNAVVFGSSARVESPVGRDLYGFAGELDVRADVGEDLNVHAGAVRVLPRARIGGDVIAHVDAESALAISPDAVVEGDVQTRVDDGAGIGRPRPSAAQRVAGFLWSQVLRFGAAFVTGLLLLWLVPPLRRIALDTPGETVVAAGVGLVALVAVPVIALMTAVTLIGLPIAVVGLLLWLIGLYFAKIVLAHWIGRKVLDRLGRETTHFAAALLVGVVLVLIVVNIPLIGGVLNFLLTITGLGMLTIFLWGLLQGRSFAAVE